ncbi:MAG: GNAT family N-acetyltransferase [Clostridia bacterium]|nr:GNAT family N-acetyltransferase [Clostridia bacterium]
MKTSAEKEFIRAGRQRQALFADEEFALIPREYAHRVSQIDGACSMVFDIVDIQTLRTAGEIALRVGEGQSLFYLGHIGYHMDPPFQGRHGALRACRMVIPLLRAMGMQSFVITTDEDNIPSVKTCERLGCVLESTVDVPNWCRAEFCLSHRKRRYIYEISKA